MYRKFGKRFMDIIIALVLLVILSPLILLLAILIPLENKGPVFFRQTRTGYKGKNFLLQKFRSMVADNDVYDLSKEDQVTRIGKFIRKTSLDEIGQIFNILRGEMSFIGPRPWIPEYAKYFTKVQKKRLDVLPGITGYAQCNGRNNLDIKGRIEYDLYYVESLSFLLDCKIVFKTVISVFCKTGTQFGKGNIKKDINILRGQFSLSQNKTGGIL